jgi:hypothetical protein
MLGALEARDPIALRAEQSVEALTDSDADVETAELFCWLHPVQLKRLAAASLQSKYAVCSRAAISTSEHPRARARLPKPPTVPAALASHHCMHTHDAAIHRIPAASPILRMIDCSIDWKQLVLRARQLVGTDPKQALALVEDALQRSPDCAPAWLTKAQAHTTHRTLTGSRQSFWPAQHAVAGAERTQG